MPPKKGAAKAAKGGDKARQAAKAKVCTSVKFTQRFVWTLAVYKLLHGAAGCGG